MSKLPITLRETKWEQSRINRDFDFKWPRSRGQVMFFLLYLLALYLLWIWNGMVCILHSKFCQHMILFLYTNFDIFLHLYQRLSLVCWFRKGDVCRGEDYCGVWGGSSDLVCCIAYSLAAVCWIRVCELTLCGYRNELCGVSRLLSPIGSELIFQLVVLFYLLLSCDVHYYVGRCWSHRLGRKCLIGMHSMGNWQNRQCSMSVYSGSPQLEPSYQYVCTQWKVRVVYHCHTSRNDTLYNSLL